MKVTPLALHVVSLIETKKLATIQKSTWRVWLSWHALRVQCLLPSTIMNPINPEGT